MENYFEVLELSIDEIQAQDEATIKRTVEAAHKRLYAFTIGPYANVPRPDGRTQAWWQNILNSARDTLLDPQSRQEHIAQLTPEPVIDPEPDPHYDPLPRQQSTRTIVKFRNGDEATSIPQLATLMEKNASEATDILYQGYLEQGLAGAGETPLAQAANAVTHQFSSDSDRSMGLVAMVAILREKIKFKQGIEASTAKELARSIDQNWEEAKILLYSGFIALWLQHTNQEKIAGTVQEVVNTYQDDQNIGLEELVQRLDPQIGKPEPEVSQQDIDFGTINANSQQTTQFKIKNVGRGFLFGEAQIEDGLPGLQISDTIVYGNGVVTIELNAKVLKAKQKHHANLVVNTNGGKINIPISCYVDNPIQQAVQRIAISGVSVAAIAVVARLIVEQVATSGWLATHLAGEGFIGWEHYWQWVEWFKWPWFEWRVFTLGGPGTGLGFVIAFTLLGIGIFGYWYFFFKKKIMS